jgi:hypothetical protein
MPAEPKTLPIPFLSAGHFTTLSVSRLYSIDGGMIDEFERIRKEAVLA